MAKQTPSDQPGKNPKGFVEKLNKALRGEVEEQEYNPKDHEPNDAYCPTCQTYYNPATEDHTGH